MKAMISQSVENIQDELFKHNRFLYDHPEIAFQEYVTSRHLIEWAISKDFSVEQGKKKLETAFVARKVVGKGGPVIGFVAEYDALKDLGHACGHNLIATMSFGAAFVLAKMAIQEELDCEIRIVGTPAEEGGGGKIHMLNAGYFDGIDCAMMIHPSDRTMVEDFSFANQIFKYTFTGKAAHASAAPWEGANAVEGMLQTLNLINGLRHQMKDYSRVNPLIISSGQANNVIPDFAEMEINIRSVDNAYLDVLIEGVHRCAKMSANTYGLGLEIESISLRYESVSNNPILERIMAKYFSDLEEEVLDRPRDTGVGSTDMGNVTRKIPAIHAHLRLGEGLKTHTIPFREATISPGGEKALKTGVEALLLTAYELIRDKSVFKEMQEAFKLQGGRK